MENVCQTEKNKGLKVRLKKLILVFIISVCLVLHIGAKAKKEISMGSYQNSKFFLKLTVANLFYSPYNSCDRRRVLTIEKIGAPTFFFL